MKVAISCRLYLVPPKTNITLRVKVEGPMIPGLLGGKGQRDPVNGAEITFSQRENDPEITFPNGPTVTSDAGGTAEIEIAIGKTTGDHHISATAESPFGDVSCEFRIVSGLALHNTRQEILSGRTSQDMLSLTVYDKDGSPLSGVPIHFLIDPFSGCHLSCREAVTDETGTGGTLIMAGTGGSPRRRAARRSALVGVGCAGPGRIGSGCFRRAAGRLGNAGAGCGEGDLRPQLLATRAFRVCPEK